MPMPAVTNVPADTPLADELADEDLVEMANLPEEGKAAMRPDPVVLRHLPYCRIEINDLDRFDVVGFA